MIRSVCLVVLGVASTACTGAIGDDEASGRALGGGPSSGGAGVGSGAGAGSGPGPGTNVMPPGSPTSTPPAPSLPPANAPSDPASTPPKTLAQGAWKPMSNVGAHPDADCPSAVWNGSKMLVVGGASHRSVVTAYDPKTDTWETLPNTNAPPGRTEGSAVWTGNELVWFGGRQFVGGCSPFCWYWESYAYAPATGSWVQKADPARVAGTHFARFGHAAAWVGGAMIAYGGSNPYTVFANAEAFDPALNTWVNLPDAPEARTYAGGAGLGGKAYFWGGQRLVDAAETSDIFSDGLVYDPAARAWARTMNGAPIAPRAGVTMAATNKELVVWGGKSAGTFYGDGASYDPATGAWAMLPGAGAPSARRCSAAVWTGQELIVWGGVNGATALANGAVLR